MIRKTLGERSHLPEFFVSTSVSPYRSVTVKVNFSMLDKKLYKQETRNTQLQNGSSFLLVPTVTMPTKYRNEQNCLDRNLSFLKSCHTTVYNEALKSNELLRT